MKILRNIFFLKGAWVMKKTVKGWVVVNSLGIVGRSFATVFANQEVANEDASINPEELSVYPCTITYSIPTKSKRKES